MSVTGIEKSQRTIGSYGKPGFGPTLVLTVAIHGNEPSGIHAARRVLAVLDAHAVAIRGQLVVFAGNLQAAPLRQRFIDRDLNRHWAEERVQALASGELEPDFAEDRELLELWTAIREVLARSRGETYFLDLHTSSAAGPPFVTVGDTLRNRSFAKGLGLPMILGLEEQVDGSLLEFLNNLGLVTAGVEGGQHDAEASVDHHESALWMALVSAGMIPLDEVPELAEHRARLERASAGIPRVVEIRHRHAIQSTDEFEMEPGFANFMSVRDDQLMGRNSRGEVRSPEAGLVLLPLYQGQGNDGFFIGREIKPFWLTLSSLLRHLGVARLAPFMPGVRPHPDRPGTLVVNTRVARLFALQALHLLGYRKLRQQGSILLVSRRKFDLESPDGSRRFAAS